MATGTQVFGLLTILAIIVVTSAAVNVKWVNQLNLNANVKTGGSLLLKCQATGVNPDDFLHITMYKKQLPADTQSDTPVTEVTVIAGNQLESMFTATKRYIHYYNMDASNVETLQINITDFQPQDNGLYRCAYDKTNTPYFRAATSAKITEVYFKKMDNLTEVKVQQGAVVTARRLENGGIGCYGMVENSLVDMTVKLSVGGSVLDNTVDRNVIRRNSVIYTDTAIPGLYRMNSYSSVQLYGENLNIDYDGQSFTCEAYTSSHMTAVDRKTAVVTLKVENEPKINCTDDGDFYSKPGRPVEIKCTVQSNPEAEVSVTWGSRGDENKLEPGVQKDDFSLSVTLGAKGRDAAFTISEVAQKHYGLKYTLIATNKYGTVEEQLKLNEGEKGDKTTTGVAAVSVNFVLIMTSLMFIICHLMS